MFYIFQSGSEYIKLKIDRIKNRLEMASSKTTLRFYPLPFSELFGVKETEEQKQVQEEMESKSDEEFEVYLVKEFLQKGYVLMKKDDKIDRLQVWRFSTFITVESIQIEG